MPAIAFDRIDHVAAGVKDLAAAVTWWCDNFVEIFPRTDIRDLGTPPHL